MRSVYVLLPLIRDKLILSKIQDAVDDSIKSSRRVLTEAKRQQTARRPAWEGLLPSFIVLKMRPRKSEMSGRKSENSAKASEQRALEHRVGGVMLGMPQTQGDKKGSRGFGR
jgi:hypothetical protein